MEPLPRLGTHPNSPHFRIHNASPGRGMLYEANRPASPTAEVRKALTGFGVRGTGAPGLSQAHRIHLLGQCTDLNAIPWTIATIRSHLVSTTTNTPEEVAPAHLLGGYTSSQPLPALVDMPLFPVSACIMHHSPGGPPPVPRQWMPRFIPEIWSIQIDRTSRVIQG
jgi:hypothetical protein